MFSVSAFSYFLYDILHSNVIINNYLHNIISNLNLIGHEGLSEIKGSL